MLREPAKKAGSGEDGVDIESGKWWQIWGYGVKETVGGGVLI